MRVAARERAHGKFDLGQAAAARARLLYEDDEARKISFASGLVGAQGHCKWTRVEEIVQFAKKMGYRKIGIAKCTSFVDHAYTRMSSSAWLLRKRRFPGSSPCSPDPRAP